MLQQQQVKSQPGTVDSKGLALAPIHKGDKFIMTKKPFLKPWAVARQLPNLQWLILACYRSRSEADGHLLLLRQRVPNIHFKVVFEQSNCKE